MEDSAFLIMQVGKEKSDARRRADEVQEFIISPVVTSPEFNLTLIRADQVVAPGAISPKMLGDLLSARVVIADLTGRNPNVYYELGIAHSFEKAVISLGQPSGLPFDVQDERVIPLPGSEEKLGAREAETAKKLLTESLRIVLDENYRPTSPLTSIASRRALDDLAPSNPIAAELASVREKIEDVQNTISGDLREIRQEVDRKEIFKERTEKMMQEVRDGTMGRQMVEAMTSNPDAMREIFNRYYETALNQIMTRVAEGGDPDLFSELRTVFPSEILSEDEEKEAT